MNLACICLLHSLILTVFFKGGDFRTIYSRRKVYSHAGDNILLECQLVELVLDKTDRQKSYVQKLEWTKNGAIVASYEKGNGGAQWWVPNPRFTMDRKNFSLTISQSEASDSSTYVCSPTFDRTVDWLRFPAEEPEYISLFVIQPAEPPSIRSIDNGTNASIVISWEQPPENSLHGPLTGYRIMIHQLQNGQRKIIHIDKPHIESYEIQGLEVYTKYQISMEVDNNYGYSPAATAIVLTEEGVPSTGPMISSLSVVSSFSMAVTWAPPKKSNGMLTHYTLYYRSSDTSTATRSIIIGDKASSEQLRSVMKFLIAGLKPYTKYFVWVTASTRKGEGPASETMFAYTDTDSPGIPVIANISIPEQKTVVVDWQQPVRHYRRVDVYVVRQRYRSETDTTEHLSSERIINTTELYIYITPVMFGQVYVLTVQAVTKSIVHHWKDYGGPLSQEEAFLLKETGPKDDKSLTLYTTICSWPKALGHSRPLTRLSGRQEVSVVCDKSLLTGPPPESQGSSGSLITLSVFSTMGILLSLAACIFGFLFWKRYHNSNSLLLHDVVPAGSYYDPFDENVFPSIPVSDFPNHIKSLRADGDSGFAREFESLEVHTVNPEGCCRFTAENSLFSANKPKNRYVNILAYDHSRVLLRPLPDSSNSDYINANYVDGFHKPRAYIATQGPLPNTFADFWRMIWEQRTLVIVMITNILERGRKKCDQYWPSEGSEIYGEQFEVRLLSEFFTASYVVRMMSIKNLKAKTVRSVERMVFHYHYTHWPDHGVPPSPLPVLTFIRKSTAANRESAGPVVVHCSAGVGRSGTYIVVESMLRQIEARKTINVFAYLRHIRQQRNFLVQTEEQYKFCYETLLEAIRIGKTEVCISDLVNYIHNVLYEDDQITKKSLLQIQYELIVHQDNLTSNCAKLVYNQWKNRHPDIFPVDNFRVPKSPKPAIEGSDYVNASFFQGFHKLDEFIVTQCPMEYTVEDFWQLVWDHNCQTLVLLCDIDDIFFKRFWPNLEEGNYDYNSFFLYATEIATSQDWQCVDFILQSSEDDFQLPCRLLHYPGWPKADYRYLYDCVLTLSSSNSCDENCNQGGKFKLSSSVPNGLKASTERNSTTSTCFSQNSEQHFRTAALNTNCKLPRDTTL